MKKVILAIAILSLGIAEANAACNSATPTGAYITDYSVFFPSIPAFCAGVRIGKSDGIDRFISSFQDSPTSLTQSFGIIAQSVVSCRFNFISLIHASSSGTGESTYLGGGCVTGFPCLAATIR
jgi:hypothetical protein